VVLGKKERVEWPGYLQQRCHTIHVVSQGTSVAFGGEGVRPPQRYNVAIGLNES